MKDFSKKLALALVVLSIVMCGFVAPVVAQSSKTGNAVEISFNYKEMTGYATNQFAIWVEDSAGKLVDTIFVTKFTTEKGWETRPDSLREWVAIANPGKNGVDASSGATPKSGLQTYSWNLKNAAGKVVADGDYVVKMQASFFMEKRVMVSTPVTVKKGKVSPAANSKPSSNGELALTKIDFPAKTPANDKNGDMISNITIKIK